jgi:lysophospholipid acyltransferase (LPLAT)-like uncharacterized protein
MTEIVAVQRRSLWRRIRKPIADSRVFKSVVAQLIAWVFRAIRLLNRTPQGSQLVDKAIEGIGPVIFASWHGQHLLAPLFCSRGYDVVAMFSRSADAELNALVAQKLGFRVVRGSGGRGGEQDAGKGGARALIQLKRELDQGVTVAMIADIPHGTPREAGLGIVTLAKISGRPIVPVAAASSRRKVIEKSWDKTTINLPFGRAACRVGAPIYVPSKSDAAELEAKRLEVTAGLNATTAEVYRLVDGGA